MKVSLWFLMVAGALALMWSVAALQVCQEPASREFTRSSLTSAMFDQIQTGMSWDDVCRVMGEEPVTSLESISPADKVSPCHICWWRDSHKNVIKVFFFQDKVKRKESYWAN